MTKERVVVALSGGLDSGVAAFSLKRSGYQVIAIHLVLSDENGDYPPGVRCCGSWARESARRVAARVGIPFYVLDCRRQFEAQVIDYFCQEYLSGRTPNPCIVCNQLIKFGLLRQKAEELGARYLASGHYATVRYDQERKRYALLRGRDSGKDQSYFLFSLRQEQLARVLFPLGEYRKEEARGLALQMELGVGTRRESQELCFVGAKSCGEFVADRFPQAARPGPIVDTSGRVRGEHGGIVFYTVGQRKGLGLSARKPLYVTGIRPAENTVVVGEEGSLGQKSLIAERMNMVGEEKLEGSVRVMARIRYNHPGSWASVRDLSGGRARVDFDQPERAVTPGQAVVFYRGEEVLGGGWIESNGEGNH